MRSNHPRIAGIFSFLSNQENPSHCMAQLDIGPDTQRKGVSLFSVANEVERFIDDRLADYSTRSIIIFNYFYCPWL
jgi:hypothetical protein